MGRTMREVGSAEAETRLSQLLDWVEAGEEVVITRDGKAVARLLPPGISADPARGREAATAIRAMSLHASLDGLTIKALVNEGRR